MKDVIRIAVVNFTTRWGDKKSNLQRIEDYCDLAGRQAANMIVFPETALTGYDNDLEHTGQDKMHCRMILM